MSEVKWIKIVTDIFDDEKIVLIESMPDSDSIIVIWFKLLCLAGKQNNNGVFLMNNRIAYTDEMLSTIFRRPVNTVRMAFSLFEQYGMVEIVNGAITIPNWEKHQSLDVLESAREKTRNRVARHREKQKELCNVTVTLCNADRLDKTREDKTREDNIPPISPEGELFDRFWSAYPRKTAKRNALKAFEKLHVTETLLTEMLAALDWQRQCEAWTKDGGQFIPHASTWLNGRRWEDERRGNGTPEPTGTFGGVKLNVTRL